MKIRLLQSMALLGNISRLSHKLIQKCNSIYCKVWVIVPMMTPQILYMKNFCLGLQTLRLVNDTNWEQTGSSCHFHICGEQMNNNSI